MTVQVSFSELLYEIPSWVNTNSPQIRNHDLIISWDTEFQHRQQKDSNGRFTDPEPMNNHVISYQISAFSFKGVIYHIENIKDTNDNIIHKVGDYKSGGRYIEGIFYVVDIDNNNDNYKGSYNYLEKLTLQYIIRTVIEKLGLTWADCSPKLIDKTNKFKILKSIKKLNKPKYKLLKTLLIAHSSIAEFSCLKGRKEKFLTDNLHLVRGTLISSKNFTFPIAWDNNRNYLDISLSWRDTIILAPDEGSKSLESISEHNTVNKKVEIKNPWNINDMKALLQENKAHFDDYALSDARVVLEYYCNFMTDYYELSGVKEEPLTIGDSVVKFYLHWLRKKSRDLCFKNANHLEYLYLGLEDFNHLKGKKAVKTEWRESSEGFASNSYKGGLNTAFWIGDFPSNSFIKDGKKWTIFDFDFANAYPSALAMIPVIDWNSLTQRTLDIEEISSLENRKIREYSKIGFYLVKFKFPANTYQPAIPCTHPDGGLIYPLEGESYCTYPELMEAFDMGCVIDKDKIVCHYYEPLKDGSGKVILAFAEFLRYLILERLKAKKEKKIFRNLLLKLMANSFYGKLGQGIAHRSVYDINKNRVQLEESKITVPAYASLTTGLIRTALITFINRLHSYPDVKVLNMTTDGGMVALALPDNINLEIIQPNDHDWFDVAKKRHGIVRPIPLSKIFPHIFKDLENQYSIAILEQGRKNMGLDAHSWLETKAIGDYAKTYKTRMNVLTYKGITQAIARGGISSKNASSAEDLRIFENIDNPNEYLEVIEKSLTSYSDIIIKDWDLTRKLYQKKVNGSIEWIEKRKKVNTDYNWKRPLVGDEGETRPPKTLEEWFNFAVAIRSSQKKGKRSTRELIELKAGSIGKNIAGIRVEGCDTVKAITRIFISYLLMDNKFLKGFNYNKLSLELNKWISLNNNNKNWEVKINDLKKWKHRQVNTNILPDNELVNNTINSLIKHLELLIFKDDWKLLLRNL